MSEKLLEIKDLEVIYKTDKEIVRAVNGISLELDSYRYVGEGNAAVMHILDLCLEEYIEYLGEHPHIAVYENGVLKYEIVRQYVGEAASFPVSVKTTAASYYTSLDNMGYAVTVFIY